VIQTDARQSEVREPPRWFPAFIVVVSTTTDPTVMAAKAFFAVAMLVAAAIGLALPTPGASHEPQATRSSFQTIPID
jgi:hypothetical protein